MENKERIIYIGGFELPDKNAAAQRVIANSKALNSLNYEVILIGLSKSQNYNKFYFDNFKCYELKYPSNYIEWIKFLFTINEVTRILKVEKPSKIIFYNYPAFKMYFLIRFLRKFNCKFYADITEWYEVSGLSIFSLIKKIDVYFRMKFVHLKMDGLIVISDYLENFYKEKVKNIINIPPLIDINENKWFNNLESRKEDNIIFTYVGSPGSGNKDKLDLIIESVKRIKEISSEKIILRVVGISEEEFINNFQINKEIWLKQDYNFLSFEGRISHVDALNFLKESNFSIFFRENNLTNTAGFPTKFVESISLGVPVITNYSSNLKYYFQKYQMIGFAINNLNEEEIFSIINQALSSVNSKLNESNSQNNFLAIFDFRNYIDKFEKLFKNEN